jgi:hypothetical protein
MDAHGAVRDGSPRNTQRVGPVMMRPETRFPPWPPVMYPDDKGPTSKDKHFMLEVDSFALLADPSRTLDDHWILKGRAVAADTPVKGMWG